MKLNSIETLRAGKKKLYIKINVGKSGTWFKECKFAIQIELNGISRPCKKYFQLLSKAL
jgi:hypothetical protein